MATTEATSSPNADNQRSGRRLITTRAVAAGEVLFVIPPVASTAVQTVYALWNEHHQQQNQQSKENDVSAGPSLSGRSTPSSSFSLQDIAEDVLVQACVKHQHYHSLSSSTTSSLLDDCLSAMQGIHQTNTSVPSIERLLGHASAATATATITSMCAPRCSTKAELRQIIRRNAFGPDLVT